MMNAEELLFNRDYIFIPPQDPAGPPRLKVLVGHFKGLVFDITQSYTAVSEEFQKLFFTYQIVNVWESSPIQDIKTIKLSEEEESFVGNLLLNYLLYKDIK